MAVLMIGTSASEFPNIFEPVFCTPYSIVSDTNSATQNYVTCTFTACAGVILTIADCGAENCASLGNDQFIRLKNADGNEVAWNDDNAGCGAGACSKITYTTTESCQLYTLIEGCYASSLCYGAFTITGEQIPNSSPTTVPTANPTLFPTAIPTCKPTHVPTSQPSSQPSNNPTSAPSYKSETYGGRKAPTTNGRSLREPLLTSRNL